MNKFIGNVEIVFDDIKILFDYLRKEYNVQPFQVKFVNNENGVSKVQLTNKIGELFAEVGEIIKI